MAYIRKLPSGKYQATVRHPAGHKVTRTDPLKRVVQRWADDLESQFRTGNVAAERGRKLTVSEWEVRWTRARHVEPSTAAKNRSHMANHILPRWGSWPLSSIGRLDVQTWTKTMTADGIGPPTIAAAYNLFSAMLSDAVLEGVIGANPCREIDLPKVVRPEPRWLTRHEYDRLQIALADEPHSHVWQAYVGLGSFSGLRPGELCGLDVEAVDFDRNLVRVQQVMTRHGMKGYGKSDSATRTVPFPPEVADLLWRTCADRSSGAVFTSPAGERVSETNFRNRVWRPALEAAGIAYERPYILRHTAASWLVQAGVPTWDIVKLLGHSSSRLVDVYAHLAPDVHDRVRVAWGETSGRTSGARMEQEEAPSDRTGPLTC